MKIIIEMRIEKEDGEIIEIKGDSIDTGEQRKDQIEFTNDKHDYPLVLEANHIAEILGVSKRVAYEIMDYSDFPLIKIGRHKKVKKDSFFKWLGDQENNNT